MSLTMEDLQGVKGLGESRINRLLDELGGLEGVASATLEQLTGVKGVSERVARSILAAAQGLVEAPEGEYVDTVNGEVEKAIQIELGGDFIVVHYQDGNSVRFGVDPLAVLNLARQIRPAIHEAVEQVKASLL